MQKRCVTCHLVKPLTDFNLRSSAVDRRQARCRECSRAWYVANREKHMRNTARRTVEVRRDNHRRLGEYLSDHPCVDCGESDVRTLEFDHENPAEKLADVTRLIAHGCNWDRVAAEIQKCSVRCANCHRKRTMRMQNSWRQAFYDEHRWTGAAARLAALLPARGAAG